MPTPTDKKKSKLTKAGTKRKKMGRPTKYTPEVGARIVGSLQVGAIPKVAAGAAGVSMDTLYRWLRDGNRLPARTRRNPQPVDGQGRPIMASLRDFADAYQKGQEACEIRQLRHIDDAARGNPEKGQRGEWTAAAWLLERRHPERYARPAQRVVHEGGTTNTNVNIDAGEVDLSQFSDAELDALDALTAKAIGRAVPPPMKLLAVSVEPPDDGE